MELPARCNGSVSNYNGEELIILNSTTKEKLISKIFDKNGNELSQIDYPVQAINDNSGLIASLNYKRINKYKPEYGYKSKVVNFTENMDYNNDGIWLRNISDNKFYLAIKINDLFCYETIPGFEESKHKINHISFSPDGNKFIFFHRWISSRQGKYSRLFLFDLNKGKLELIMNEKMLSHFCWKDNNNVLIYGRFKGKDDYYLINTENKKVNLFINDKLSIFGDGHPSFSPDKKWLITDTYPDKSRKQKLILVNLSRQKPYIIGEFFSPLKFENETRCDLHPRWSPDGNSINIDSVFEGKRNSYLINIEKVINYEK